jgi:curved DNA-binding protein CbpA
MLSTSSGTNYYEVLEITVDAPAHEIHKAYQRAKATYSSDNPALYTMFSADEARELLRLIEEAYSVLSNPGARRTYDDARARGELASFESIQKSTSAGPVTASPVTLPPVEASPVQGVMSAHQALPDFTPPEEDALPIDRKFAAGAGVSAKPPLPPGTGRTTLSTFKIDESFESELESMSDFDGAMLQRVRIYKNIPVERMSDATRISRPYLVAVETNDFKSLPAAVFVRGFVIQIARILGLNEQKVASSYMKMFKAGGGK